MYRLRRHPRAAVSVNHSENGCVVDRYVGVRDGRVNVLRATAPAATDRVKSRQSRLGSLRTYRSIRRHRLPLPTNGGAHPFPRHKRRLSSIVRFRRLDGVVC
ncbi:hypothetical protein LSAT2_003581, partial [Lamellibrachia satsuma]